MESEIVKNYMNLFKKNKHKSLNFLIIIGLMGLLMLSFAKITSQEKVLDMAELSSVESKDNLVSDNDIQLFQSEMEKRLEQILSQIEGAGRVKVMVTLESEGYVEPAFNSIDNKRVTEENDSEGGVRTITEIQANKQIVLLNKGGKEEPLLVKKLEPTVKGVLIVAEGGNSSQIVDRITKATSTLLGIPLYKIKVLPFSK
ncbi:stage III sporulation protein AG [Thermovorax subterraneus]|nr:stage III sporulation protein AG [Thermovorax subterraneus]